MAITKREASQRRVAAQVKRALERRLRRAGCPRKDAERIVARMSHSERLKRLPFWEVLRVALTR